ncbi:hypothetical protein ISCGN_010101 [Ixodes scapularis]
MGTQTSPDDLHLPSRSPSKPPRAAPVAPPPNRKVNAALPASAPEQEMSSPAQPAASTSRGRGLPPHTSAPQRKPGEVPKQSTSKGQLPATADEPMDEESLRYGMAGSFAEVVLGDPAPRSESRATQVSPEILVADFRARLPDGGSSCFLQCLLYCDQGSYAEAVRRGPARPVVSMGTQTSPDDLHLPSRSPSKPPRAAPVAPPPNRKVNAALPASAPEQEMSSPAQPAASTSRGRGLPPHTSAPQRKPGEVPKQSTSKGQLPATADEPMDEESLRYGMAGSFAEVVLGDPAPRSESRATQVSPEILVADFRAWLPDGGSSCFLQCLLYCDQKGGYAQVVQRGPAPLKVAVATQTSFLDYGKPRQSPTPQLKIQLPGRAISAGRSTDPPSQSANPRAPTGQQPGSSQTVSQTQEGPVAAATVPPPRSPSREKGRHSRPHSLERASSKERHGSRAAPAAPRGQEQVDLGDASPSTSSAPLAGSGRGRRMAPRSPNLKNLEGKASPQETEAMDECEVSTPASDQDDMEWQTSKSKHKSKKPVIPPT